MSEFNPLPQPATAPASLGQRFDYLRGFVQRQYLAIVLGLVIALPIGAFYALSSPKTYTASSTMTIESRKGPMDEPGRAAPLDMAWFETNLQNLRSVNVLGYVVKQLNLANDPEFLRSDKGPLDRLLSGSAGRCSAQVRRRAGQSCGRTRSERDKGATHRPKLHDQDRLLWPRSGACRKDRQRNGQCLHLRPDEREIPGVA